MGLKNEAKSAFESTKNLYRDYVEGMNRERLEREFYADSQRLKQLYMEATGEDKARREERRIPFHIKILRLFSALGRRLTPTRRLIFGIALFSFIFFHLTTGILSDLLLITSFCGLLMILLVELLEKIDVKREIDLAREIQLSLLPESAFQKDELDVYSFANTAQEVGGDYIDTIETGKGVYVIIADVSGKGLSAALYMVRVQALVHLIIKKYNPTPKKLFLELNNYVKSGIKDKTFVTACAAYFPFGQDHFLISRAGHTTPICYNSRDETTSQLRFDGFALGMTSNDSLESFLSEKKIPFHSGDSVLLYTDGLNEARNEHNELFGTDRLTSLMEIYGSMDARSITHKIQLSLEGFLESIQPDDDITFTCIHRK